MRQEGVGIDTFTGLTLLRIPHGTSPSSGSEIRMLSGSAS